MSLTAIIIAIAWTVSLAMILQQLDKIALLTCKLIETLETIENNKSPKAPIEKIVTFKGA